MQRLHTWKVKDIRPCLYWVIWAIIHFWLHCAKGGGVMGWTSCMHSCYWKYDKKGNRTVDRKAELDALFTWERKEPVESYGHVYPPMKDTVLKSSMVGSVYYAAVKRERPGKEPMVWAAICLTHGRGRDGSVWGYKDMCELPRLQTRRSWALHVSRRISLRAIPGSVSSIRLANST